MQREKKMKRKIFAITIATLLILTVSPIFAEEDEGTFHGGFEIGYRNISTDGSMNKYKQHLNLETGASLYGFHLQYEPAGNMKKYVDYFHIYLDEFGGEPFASMGLEVRKYGAYNFTYQRREALYFYEDIYMDGHNDFHSYDFERTIDTANLRIILSKQAILNLGFDRYEKRGESITTLDWRHAEYEFERPIHEVKKEYNVGFTYMLDGFSLTFDEKIREYENTYTMLFAGEPDMGNTVLDYFFSAQPYDFTSYAHTARIVAKPSKWLIFRGAMTLESLEMNMDYNEIAQGVSYNGSPVDETLTGEGTINRDIALYNFDISLLLSDKLAIIGAFRYHDFEQDGNVTVDGDETMRDWKFTTTGFDGGLEYALASNITLAAGIRNESREVEHGEDPELQKTTQTGFYGNFTWKPSKGISINGDYQMGSYDDPFALTSPTDLSKFRISVRAKLSKNFFANAIYMMKTLENDVWEWSLDHSQINVGLGYHSDKFYGSLNYRMLSIEQNVTRTLVFYGSPKVWEVLYEGNTSIISGYLHWKISKNLGLGGFINYLDNQDTWAISRIDFKGFIEYKFCGGYLVKAGYRYVDYQEKEEGFNDYTANIAEFSVGYRW
jgi:opacity protein-like surface antigen